MVSNANGHLPQFTFAETLMNHFINYFMRRKTTLIKNKIISDSSNNACNISIYAYIRLP